MKPVKLVAALAGSCALGAAQMAAADVVYEQAFGAASANGAGYYADDPQWTQYDNFSLAQATVVDGLTLWGNYGQFPLAQYPSTFRISIHTDTSWTAPLYTLQVTADSIVNTGYVAQRVPNNHIFELGFDLGGLQLEAGQYWLGVQAINPLTTNSFYWSPAAVASDGLFYSQNQAGVTYARQLTDRAFSLQGTPVDVPEPATLALLGLGLVGVGAARKRRPKSA